MSKPIIHEIIIVEGRDDTRRLKEVFECDTIETGGSAINDTIMSEIETALNTRGAIIFTDPDFPGHKIRHQIIERFPNIKEAFLTKEKARSKLGKIGIEHAKDHDLIDSLKQVVSRSNNSSNIEEISMRDMVQMKLNGHPNSKWLRLKLSESLNIGYANASQMRNKFNRYQISKDKVISTIQEIEKEN